MPDLHRGPIVRGAICPGDFTDDGSEGLDLHTIERDWVANCELGPLLAVARETVEEADSQGEERQLGEVGLRNIILRFIDDLENVG